MESNQNILTPLLHFADRTPHAIAMLGPDYHSITYSQLLASIQNIVDLFLQSGLEKKNRVALVSRDGPEMATLFLAISGVMTCAPLNPNYTYEEYKFYLSDLKTDALIVNDEILPAIKAAEDLGVKIMLLSEILNVMTRFTSDSNNGRDITCHLAQNGDTALILHTSGTTSRPKIVPLTHQNISASVINIIDSLMLTKTDRCLNVMPLFHIHGLIITILSSLAVGGSIVCSRGFIPEQFYKSIEQFSPTWYTAVPTIHQAILTYGRLTSFNPNRSSFRLIRSSSAALSLQLAREMEQLFQVPVLAAYGMTETGQLTINPLPPGQSKAGSSGKAVGCEVAVMDQNGMFVGSGAVGEIVVRGTSVISGYENNSEANQNSFHVDWLRTGDQGYLDSEGYLFINGRIKEIINRGGEKIMPGEVEEVILRHPSVMQAAAFSIPHSTLGEDIAVLIVTQPDKEVSETDIRRFAAASLADFKVPAKVLFTNEIPKGPTGKIQRFGLAEKLGLVHQSMNSVNRPKNITEKKLIRIWAKILNTPSINVTDNFFDLGGNSLLTMQLISEINKEFKTNLPVSIVFQENTIEKLAAFINSSQLELTSSLVSIKPNGDKPPIFCVHDLSGEVVSYWNLANEIKEARPMFGLRYALDDDALQVTIQQMASNYIEQIKKKQPEGPYYLLGYSLGGTIVYEMALQLYRQRQEVALLAILDSRNPRRYPNKKLLGKISKNVSEIIKQPWSKKIGFLKRGLTNFVVVEVDKKAQNFIKAINGYYPEPYPGNIVLFSAKDNSKNYTLDDKYGWETVAGGEMDVYKVPGDHYTLLEKPNAPFIANYLNDYLK
jgi:acyl-CoA synthetase (AMP-forming)/AMP-acid ligase II/thioesterase domain-containing protein/acyl carrier protein